MLAERSLSPRHALDLLQAFRLDVTKRRYEDWDDLMAYCRLSAMPVGRFVLEVHGEPASTWEASDPLCAALQVINHLQDCGEDYRSLDRVYLPLDALRASGAGVEALGMPAASDGLRLCVDGLCDRVEDLLATSAGLSRRVGNARLALEISVIQRLAERLVFLLRTRDPLAGRVHLGRLESASFAALGLLREGGRRVVGGGSPAIRLPGGEAGDEAARSPAASAASGSSFYAAMRILPRERRGAIFEVYGFCRAVDDIADEAGEREDRLARLEGWRADIDAIYAGQTPPHLSHLAAAVRDFGLKREDFMAVIDGVEMDVIDDIRAPDMATLELYCDRVACAVGRLCVRIFGLGEAEGIALAHHLGMALQLTNTLRDVDEDAAIGRLYMPRECLVEAGIDSRDPKVAIAHPGLDAACRKVARLAEAHFVEADAIMAGCPRAEVRAPRIMGDAYRSILANLVTRGWAPPRRPVRLGRGQIAGILLRRFVW